MVVAVEFGVEGDSARAARAVIRRRRALAGVLASLLLHAGFVLVILTSAVTGTFAGGAGRSGEAGGDGAAVTVTLVGPVSASSSAPSKPTPQSLAAARLDAMARQVRADEPQTPVVQPAPAAANLDRLFNEISQSHAAAGGQGVEGSADARGDNGHVAGDMWSHIETCWRPDAPVPVALEIVIDPGGRLVLPPKIIRPDHAQLDERRLRAEARAIEAVAQCAPFRTGAPLFGRKTYRFQFGARK